MANCGSETLGYSKYLCSFIPSLFIHSNTHLQVEELHLAILGYIWWGYIFYLLFVWKCLYVSFISNGWLSWIHYSSLTGYFFSFSNLKISCYSLLACKASLRPAVRQIGAFSVCFPLDVLRILQLWELDYKMSWSRLVS